jgi:site-specific recombinase XerD
MLHAYRRHVKSCKFKDRGRDYQKCQCPVWVDGTLGVKRLHKTCDTRSWQVALDRIREWELAGEIVKPKAERLVEITEAVDVYLKDCELRGLADNTISGLRSTLRNAGQFIDKSPCLLQFAQRQGLVYMSDLNLDWCDKFRQSWKVSAATAAVRLVIFGRFGAFAVTRGWWPENYVAKLSRPKVHAEPTLPFSGEEMARILAACQEVECQGPDGGSLTKARLAALVMVMAATGLRIGDAVMLHAGQIDSQGRIAVHTQKRRRFVRIPVQPYVLEALRNCGYMHGAYWFWDGRAKPINQATAWRDRRRSPAPVPGYVRCRPAREGAADR